MAGGFIVLAGWGWPGADTASAKACVWKVTDNAGHTLYLAGSVHALRPTDYPLPPEYLDALNASDGLSFETDENVTGEKWTEAMQRASTLPDGVTLKDKVDPRTYAYMRKVVTKFHGSGDLLSRLDHLKPWFIADLLNSPTGKLASPNNRYGVEAFLVVRARKARKKLGGLETFDEHIAVLGNMSDADSEAMLLLGFIQLDQSSAIFNRTVADWKRGDVSALDHEIAVEYRDAPGVHRRMLTDRNEHWLPTLDRYLRSGRTWMVVAGAGHMAGEQGVPALLQAKGYKVEQL